MEIRESGRVGLRGMISRAAADRSGKWVTWRFREPFCGGNGSLRKRSAIRSRESTTESSGVSALYTARRDYELMAPLNFEVQTMSSIGKTLTSAGGVVKVPKTSCVKSDSHKHARIVTQRVPFGELVFASRKQYLNQ